jgi:hypothetical protein
MAQQLYSSIIVGLKNGCVIPYLGVGALKGSTHAATGIPIPAGSDQLILAINRGKPMAPKLMYEFPRAAMHIELKSGRSAVNRALTTIYDDPEWSTPALYHWLSNLDLPYLIDINRDTLLQRLYAQRPHYLIEGISRIGGTDYRFRIYRYQGGKYLEISQEELSVGIPILFKPMGTPWPAHNYIASDADYVDYITELMGGFAIPNYLKAYRKEKQYLFLGLRLNRDTERMVMTEITRFGDATLGWALIEEPTAKERRFCDKMGITIIESGIDDLLAVTQGNPLEVTA